MIWKKSEADEPQAPAQPQPQPPPAPSSRPQVQPAKERALIGPSIEIKGTLAGGEDLYVEGRVEGKIELRQHSVTIGKSGRVRADIFGSTIVVQGEVDGNLFGEEQISLRQSSTVRGNLTAPRVMLEDGSHFKGSIDMTAKNTTETPLLPAAGSESRPLVPQMQRLDKTSEKV